MIVARSSRLPGIMLLAVLSCQDAGAPEPLEADIEALRALPYVDYTADRVEASRSGVVLLDREHAYPGFNLYSNRNLCSAYLVDLGGRVVRSWADEGCHHWTNVELLPEGDLVVAGMDAIEGEDEERRDYVVARYLLRLSWDGEVVWKARIPAHHDVEIDPRGRLLTLTLSYRRLPAFDPRIDVRDNGLAMVAAAGDLLEEVSLYDVLSGNPEVFRLERAGFKRKAGEEELDLFHANSVEWIRRPRLAGDHPIYAPGNVLVSLRHQDAIVVVDWERRRPVWSWGKGEISGPHDATLLESGNILLFDNGLDRGWSRVIELDPIAERIVWEYRAPRPEEFFTASRGASQRLPNGNTLITNSDSGQVFEVTAAGEKVWEFLNPALNDKGQRASIVRMKRYAADSIRAVGELSGG